VGIEAVKKKHPKGGRHGERGDQKKKLGRQAVLTYTTVVAWKSGVHRPERATGIKKKHRNHRGYKQRSSIGEKKRTRIFMKKKAGPLGGALGQGGATYSRKTMSGKTQGLIQRKGEEGK